MQWTSWVNGKWAEGDKAETGEIINPATQEVVASLAVAGERSVNQAIQTAWDAFHDGRWSRLAYGERAACLFKLADLIESKQADFVHWESVQSGKPVKLVQYSDIPFGLDNLRYFAGAGRVLEGQATAEYNGLHTSWIRREPLGVVGAIAPWNYPPDDGAVENCPGAGRWEYGRAETCFADPSDGFDAWTSGARSGHS